ncbi:MAG TPA: DUF554 family protein [Verrucomicrobiae bacterium]|nr:DUF554 family protein [Verrucomicrobiae bacterium]
MIGTILNVAGILIGGIIGLSRRKPLPAASEAYFKVVLGAFTVFYGLRLTWQSISGSFGEILKQLLIVVIALALGKLVGHLLRLQRMSNRVGRWARDNLSSINGSDPERNSKGFKTCAALFCAAPLGILGAVQDGLTMSDYFYPLAIKGVMDGLATLSFVSLFGPGVLLAAVPVFALEGSVTLICSRALEPMLTLHNLVGSVNAVGGLLVFCVALVVLGLKRIELADYLPSLFVAPLLTFFLR